MIEREVDNLGLLQKAVVAKGSINFKEEGQSKLGYMIIPKYHKTLSMYYKSTHKAESSLSQAEKTLNLTIQMIE